MNLLDSLMSDRILLAEWMLAAAAQTVPRHHNTVAVTQQLSSRQCLVARKSSSDPILDNSQAAIPVFVAVVAWPGSGENAHLTSSAGCCCSAKTCRSFVPQQFLFYRKFFFLGDCPNLLKYDISFLFTKMNLIHLMMSFSTRIKNIYLVVATLFRQLYFQNKCKDSAGPS